MRIEKLYLSIVGHFWPVNNNLYCRVTNCSPHLDGNRRWAQTSPIQWICKRVGRRIGLVSKNWASSDSYNSHWRLGTWPRRIKHVNKLGSYVRVVKFGQFNGFESSPRGMILDKMISFGLYFSRCYSSSFFMFLLFFLSLFLEGLTPLYSPSLLDPIVHLSVI